MKGFIGNIERLTTENSDFRRVLYTAHHSQLVVMCLQPNEDIGEEVHPLDQFIRIEEGAGRVVLDGLAHEVSGGSAILIPAGIKHNVINTSDTHFLKLYTLYAPPEHRDGIVRKTKAEAVVEEENFDGKTTE